MSKICWRCFVSGRVQGVFYRDSARRKAIELGDITGWVRNLPDGRVEVMACGEQDLVMTFHRWLRKGPPLAKVTDILSEELPWEQQTGFVVRRT